MITMIGGEMPEYAEEQPAAAGLLYRHLLERLPRDIRVLVAGPHDAGLISALADRRDVTCLVRSQPDAEALAGTDVTVLCGTLSKLTDTDRYDVVVALDGTTRLCSPEGPQLDWADAVRVLKRALRPGGTLLLVVENELGVHRLVDPGTPTAPRTGDAWHPLAEFGSSPGHPGGLAAALGAEGLPVTGLAAAWPLPAHPTLLISPETLRSGPLDALAALAASATAPAYQEKSVLSDPRRLTAAAVRRGIGAELAPAWLALAQRAAHAEQSAPLTPMPTAQPGQADPLAPVPTGQPGQAGPLAPVPTAQPGQAGPLAPVLIAGPGGVVSEVLAGDDGTWLRRAVHGPDELNGPLPAGRLLEEQLLSAALGHDQPNLRRLLAGWMAALPAATADNVLVDGESYTTLDPSVPERPDALARFAHTLVTGGYHHPWPGITDVTRLAEVLAGAAGLTHAPVPLSEPPRVPDTRREHEEQLDALRRQLAEAEASCRFFEVELEKREAELGRAKTQIAAFSGNLSYRAAKAGLVLARAARNRIRKGRS